MASQPIPTGRRAVSRLRLSLPGLFLAVGGNLNCIVTNLSQTGVLIALADPLEIGEQGYLRSGPIDHFMTVTRKERGLNALKFDNPLSYDFVVQMRTFQETMAQRDENELLETVRGWTEGANRGRI